MIGSHIQIGIMLGTLLTFLIITIILLIPKFRTKMDNLVFSKILKIKEMEDKNGRNKTTTDRGTEERDRGAREEGFGTISERNISIPEQRNIQERPTICVIKPKPKPRENLKYFGD